MFGNHFHTSIRVTGESWYFLSIKIMLMPKVLNTTCLYEMRQHETTNTKLFWPFHSNLCMQLISTPFWNRYFSFLPSSSNWYSLPQYLEKRIKRKNNQNSCSLSKILVYNLSIVPFNRSIANSSNSSKVMLSVGGTLYICKPCVCFLAFCELSRGLVRLLLFFRLPEKSIFLGRCLWLWERYFGSTFFPPND